MTSLRTYPCHCQQCGHDWMSNVPKPSRCANRDTCSSRIWYTDRKPITRPLTERFWSKVNKNGPVPEHRPELGPCHIWTGWINTETLYGELSFTKGEESWKDGAHRVSWELQVGPIPDGLWVLHKCDNPACVRPDHLFLGDRSANMQDAAKKGRIPGNRNCGEKCIFAILNWEKVRAIRARAANGVKLSIIAKDNRVSMQNVWMIVKQKTWKGTLPTSIDQSEA